MRVSRTKVNHFYACYLKFLKKHFYGIYVTDPYTGSLLTLNECVNVKITVILILILNPMNYVQMCHLLLGN